MCDREALCKQKAHQIPAVSRVWIVQVWLSPRLRKVIGLSDKIEL